MIALDPYLTAFISGNWQTLTLLFGILVGLAKVSPWKWDEKVLAVIISPFQIMFDKLGNTKGAAGQEPGYVNRQDS